MKIQTASLALYGLPVVLTILHSTLQNPNRPCGHCSCRRGDRLCDICHHYEFYAPTNWEGWQEISFCDADLRITLDVPTCIQENIISACGEQEKQTMKNMHRSKEVNGNYFTSDGFRKAGWLRVDWGIKKIAVSCLIIMLWNKQIKK